MLRHFHLFELEDEKVRMLEELAAADLGRDVRVFAGDFNVRVDEILRPDVIGPNEATFCLLDQRTFECKWSTVQRLAEYKSGNKYKIELFYFLAQGWLNRALRTRTRAISLQQVHDWWGRDDFEALKDMRGADRARLMARRFQDALRYKYATHYEIYRTRGGLRVMYYMIHATDHPAAPRLMEAAYDEVVRPPVQLDQEQLPFG
jgi:three-Cys-motif partner protein